MAQLFAEAPGTNGQKVFLFPSFRKQLETNHLVAAAKELVGEHCEVQIPHRQNAIG